MWVLHAGRTTLEGPVDEQMLSAIRRTISARCGEIWLEHQQGPILGIVMGGNRAMVLRLAESGDAGFHAIDPEASPEGSGEYVLANGQVDQYADRDTVEVRHIVPIATHFLATLDRWPGVTWQDDNAI
ncbi:hypothetical protein [Micromonospora zamorensis]|uniref:hypothetical protein n=1 Tax=Micromonospora zamorensis TaxID=709883 RepID=UPI0033D71258